jgi:cobyrinic acid a,c-diamide synthase
MSAIPRIVVSAPSSGHGKTAVSVGLLAALNARGLRPSGFKIGPDFVDAAYLGLAAGRRGRNLDPRLVGAHRIAPLFAHGAAGSDIAVVEGTMGLYDGLTSRTDSESTAQIAGLLRSPVVLVVDVAAMGQSAAALVHGFRTYDELLWLGGVVLTRTISSRHEHLLRESLADIGVPVLGALRRRDLAALGAGGAALPPREQGLAPAAQRSLEALRGTRRLGELIASAVDLDRVLMLARSAPRLAADPWSPVDSVAVDDPTGDMFAPYGTGHRPVIAVAAAYGYAEMPELLTAAGAEVIAIDPLRDERLPDRIDALVVPGGLPEAYADQLSANTRLRGDVLALARTGRPIIAEGAGMVWLGRELDGLPMCGVIDTVARTTDRYVVGYREASACTGSVVHGHRDTVTGHKLHRTNVSPRAGSRPAWTWAGGQPEGFVEGAVHGSYLSVHWAGVPTMAPRLVSAAGALSAAYAPPQLPARTMWAIPGGVYKSPAAAVTPAMPPPYITDGDDLPPLEPWAPEIPPRVEPAAGVGAVPSAALGAESVSAVPVSVGPVAAVPVSAGPMSDGSTPPGPDHAAPEPVILAAVPVAQPDAVGWPELPRQLSTTSEPEAGPVEAGPAADAIDLVKQAAPPPEAAPGGEDTTVENPAAGGEPTTVATPEGRPPGEEPTVVAPKPSGHDEPTAVSPGSSGVGAA